MENKFSDDSPFAKLIKSLTKLFASTFKDRNNDGLVRLDTMVEELKDYLNTSDGHDPLKSWVNDNAISFMEKVKLFGQENNDKLIELSLSGKYGELKELILNGIAKDLHLQGEYSDLPDNVLSNPNRRSLDVIANATEDVRNFADEESMSATRDLLDYVADESAKELSRPSTSAMEKDKGINYEQGNYKHKVMSRDEAREIESSLNYD